jgi:transcriptional regulator with XRE-family HTH domain
LIPYWYERRGLRHGRSPSLTQRELAERIGHRQATIARWERGDRFPSFEDAQSAVGACGLALDVQLVPEDRSWSPQIAAQLDRTPERRVRHLVPAGVFDAMSLVEDIDPSMGIVGALSNPLVQGELGQLSEKLAEVAAGGGPRCPSSFDRKRRAGALTEAIGKVLEDVGGPMRMYEIHAAAGDLLDQSVPRSTVKNCLANNCRGERARFVRVVRGRYGLRF